MIRIDDVRAELDRLEIPYPAKGEKGSRKRGLRKLLPSGHAMSPKPLTLEQVLDVIEGLAEALEKVLGPVGAVAAAIDDLLDLDD